VSIIPDLLSISSFIAKKYDKIVTFFKNFAKGRRENKVDKANITRNGHLLGDILRFSAKRREKRRDRS